MWYFCSQTFSIAAAVPSAEPWSKGEANMQNLCCPDASRTTSVCQLTPELLSLQALFTYLSFVKLESPTTPTAWKETNLPIHWAGLWIPEGPSRFLQTNVMSALLKIVCLDSLKKCGKDSTVTGIATLKLHADADGGGAL